MSTQTNAETTSIAPESVDSVLCERQSVDESELRELADSIAQEGQIDPVTVRRHDGDTLELVEGFRRFEAIKRFGDTVGVSKIRAEVIELNDTAAFRRLAASNEFRREWTAYDKCHFVEKVASTMDDDDPPSGDIADVIGMSRSWVSKNRNRSDDPDDVKEARQDGVVDDNGATKLAQESDAEKRRMAEELLADDKAETVNEALDKASDTTDTARDIADTLGDLSEKRNNAFGNTLKAAWRESLKDRISAVESRIDDIWDDQAEQLQERVAEVEEARETVDRLESAVEWVDSVTSDARTQADSLELSESDKSDLSDAKDEYEQYQNEVGEAPPSSGDCGPTVTQTAEAGDNGKVTYQVNVTFDEGEPPAWFERVRDVKREMKRLRDTVTELETRRRRAVQLADLSVNGQNELGKLQKLVTELPGREWSDVDDSVRAVLTDNASRSLTDLQADLSDAKEVLESEDMDKLENAREQLADESDREQRLESRRRRLNDRLPPQGTKGTAVSQFKAVQSAFDRLRDTYESAPESVDDERIETWREQYPSDWVDYLTGERDTYPEPWDSRPAVLQTPDGDGDDDDEPDVSTTQLDGGWYEITDGDRTLKVQGGDDTGTVADEWRTDGFAAAQELANDL